MLTKQKVFYKILINLFIWHLKPYHITFTSDQAGGFKKRYNEYGFLCFKLIIG